MKEGFDPQESPAGGLPHVLRDSGGVVAIAKPAGLATQAPPGLPSVEAWLRARLPLGAYVGVPHRLDRAVSGVLLMATTPRAARVVSRQFERRQVRKGYLAVVHGPGGPPDAEAWRDWIVKVADEPRVRLAAATEAGAKEAVTHARVVARLGAGRAVLELEPLTGRMHQLRVQAGARGLPIVGDPLYGSGEPFGPPGGDERTRPIALHAWRITFTDPATGEPATVVAPVPDWWPADVRAATAS